MLVYCVPLKEKVSPLRAKAHLCLFTATFSGAVHGRCSINICEISKEMKTQMNFRQGRINWKEISKKELILKMLRKEA